MQHWNHVDNWMAFHKILCIYCVRHLDVYKTITYTIKYIYMCALHTSNVTPTIIAKTFIVASMLLTCVAGRYYGAHRTFCFIDIHASFWWWVTNYLNYNHIHLEYLCHMSMQHWNHVNNQMTFQKILCIDFVGHLDAYKNITYTMEWIYILALHASNDMLVRIARTFIMASMLLTWLAERYYGVHRPSSFSIVHQMMMLQGGWVGWMDVRMMGGGAAWGASCPEWPYSLIQSH